MKKLSFSKITKYYGKNLILDNVSLEIPYGEIVGILGLNGAGKTTLFNCITSIINNSEGVDIFTDKNEYSYMSKLNLYDYQSISEIIYVNDNTFNDFAADYANILFNECGIDKRKNYNDFSLGQKNLIDFIIAISRNCNVYILDEPLSNVDIHARKYIKNKIIEKSSENNIILISTHDIENFENLFSGISVLHNHKLTEYTDTEKIRENGISVSEFYWEIIRGEKCLK